jgi:hypothetical protein
VILELICRDSSSSAYYPVFVNIDADDKDNEEHGELGSVAENENCEGVNEKFDSDREEKSRTQIFYPLKDFACIFINN